jgi:hypothetical protein
MGDGGDMLITRDLAEADNGNANGHGLTSSGLRIATLPCGH